MAVRLQIVRFRDFNVRSDDHLKTTLKRSNVVINLMGLEKETPNFSFEDVHIGAAERIAKACAESGAVERLIHVSCLGASESSSSRRLRTKVIALQAQLQLHERLFSPTPCCLHCNLRECYAVSPHAPPACCRGACSWGKPVLGLQVLPSLAASSLRTCGLPAYRQPDRAPL